MGNGWGVGSAGVGVKANDTAVAGRAIGLGVNVWVGVGVGVGVFVGVGVRVGVWVNVGVGVRVGVGVAGIGVTDGRVVGVAVASDKPVPGVVVIIQRLNTVVSTRMKARVSPTSERFGERCIACVSFLQFTSA
jgi:hypothetical protein